MSRFQALTKVLLRYDLRDWSTLVFTFLFPAGLLVVFALTMRDSVAGMDLTGLISANVMAFGAAFVGIFAGATHLVLWRENGMLTVLRSFPISSNTVITAQATAGVALLLGQIVALVVIAIMLGVRPEPTAPVSLIGLASGYLLFFMLGVIVGIVVPSMAGMSMAAIVLIIPLGMIGGAMMPVETLPSWVQAIAPYTPIYHIREAVAMPLIGEGSWNEFGIGVAYLVGVASVLTLFAQRSMKWQ